MSVAEYNDLKNLANVMTALLAIRAITEDDSVIQLIDLRRVTAQLVAWEVGLNKKNKNRFLNFLIKLKFRIITTSKAFDFSRVFFHLN